MRLVVATLRVLGGMTKQTISVLTKPKTEKKACLGFIFNEPCLYARRSVWMCCQFLEALSPNDTIESNLHVISVSITYEQLLSPSKIQYICPIISHGESNFKLHGSLF